MTTSEPWTQMWGSLGVNRLIPVNFPSSDNSLKKCSKYMLHLLRNMGKRQGSNLEIRLPSVRWRRHGLVSSRIFISTIMPPALTRIQKYRCICMAKTHIKLQIDKKRRSYIWLKMICPTLKENSGRGPEISAVPTRAATRSPNSVKELRGITNKICGQRKRVHTHT